MMTHDAMIVLLSLLTTYSDAACEITNCAQCNDNAVLGCISCNGGFWFQSGACIQCPSQCSVCTDSLQCQSCVTSRWNPAVLCESVCSSNCSDRGCNDNTAYCYECKPGKYGQRCEEDCSQCVNGICDLKQCRGGCIDGYLQDDRHDNYSYCLPCSSNCIECSNTTYCTQCKQGFYGDYYRNPVGGRGHKKCKKCLETCAQCTSNDQCPEECKYECIKQECDVPGGCVTTRSTSGTSTILVSETWTTESFPQQPYTSATITPGTWTSEGIPRIPDTSATDPSLCPNECKDSCDKHGECHTLTASNSKLEGVYYEAFGHGIATGIGILIVVGALAGVVIFFTRRTKCLRTICPTNTTRGSRENHVYVNTQEEAGTMPTSRNGPLQNEVNTNSEIHVTLSEEDVDTNREYVSLGERQSENHYSALQTNRRDDH